MRLYYFVLNSKVMMSLKLHKVSMPPLRVTGQSAKLSCLYDMGGDVLYSIKWYSFFMGSEL